MTDPRIYQDDFALMEDHYHDLAHDSSVVHFYFDDLYKEKESAFEAPPPMGNAKKVFKKESSLVLFMLLFGLQSPILRNWLIFGLDS